MPSRSWWLRSVSYPSLGKGLPPAGAFPRFLGSGLAWVGFGRWELLGDWGRKKKPGSLVAVLPQAVSLQLLFRLLLLPATGLCSWSSCPS